MKPIISPEEMLSPEYCVQLLFIRKGAPFPVVSRRLKLA
jgi:hypothetical protein